MMLSRASCRCAHQSFENFIGYLSSHKWTTHGQFSLGLSLKSPDDSHVQVWYAEKLSTQLDGEFKGDTSSVSVALKGMFTTRGKVACQNVYSLNMQTPRIRKIVPLCIAYIMFFLIGVIFLFPSVIAYIPYSGKFPEG